MKLWKFYTALNILLFSVSVNSAVIEYDENINGDLAIGGQSIGNLDIGLNTVSGTTSQYDGPIWDFDSFVFTVLNGQQVDSIYIDYTFTDTIAASFSLVKYPYGYPGFGFEEIPNFRRSYFGFQYDLLPMGELISSGTDIMSYFDADALTPGTYAILGDALTSSGELQYDWGLNVSAVPVPAAVWLFGSGLIGLVGFAKRKKA